MVGRYKGGPKFGGRTAGTPNKVGRSVKAIFEEVFNLLQEDQKVNLHQWAKENPTDYYKLSGKLIPAAIEGGDPDKPLHVKNTLNINLLGKSD